MGQTLVFFIIKLLIRHPNCKYSCIRVLYTRISYRGNTNNEFTVYIIERPIYIESESINKMKAVSMPVQSHRQLKSNGDDIVNYTR